MKIKKFMTPEMYVERVEGSEEWYLGVAFEEDVCDLFEAEMMEKEEKDFMGNCPYFFHYPDGAVYHPFPKKKHVYYENPVWDKDRFGVLAVDFSLKMINIYTYIPGEKPELLHSLCLDEVEDCYNLKLEMSPWILGRQTNNEYEAIWPIKMRFPRGDRESLICRNGTILYFSRWTEDPFYHEYVVTVDMETGEEICVEKGSLYLMPDGNLWNI